FLQLAADEGAPLGREPPVDQARIVSRAIFAEITETVAAAGATGRGEEAPLRPPPELGGEGAERGVHDDLGVEGGPRALGEEAEGETRGHAQRGYPRASPRREGDLPRDQPVLAGVEPRQVAGGFVPTARRHGQRTR